MFTLIKMDLKQRVKHPLTWFIILILCIMSMLNIIETKNARFNRRFSGHDVYSLGNRGFTDWTFGWGKVYGDREMKLYPKAYYSDSMLNKVQEDLLKANEENNIKEITRLMSFYDLLFAKASSITNDPIMNEIFQKKVINIWMDVSGGIPYEDIGFIIREDSDAGNWFLLSAKYYYQLYLNNLEPIYSDDVNNITYLYEYFFNILPKFIIIIPILFIYNIINKEKNIGSLKLVLTQSISRCKYYISKWLSGVIHIIFILFFPSVVISILLGLKKGFVPLNYPTFYLMNLPLVISPQNMII
ncbi:ABC transporter permease subunit [Tissierella praeacuta]|uniref:ABC transporter permease subunit n=1 Tax=Tissierella praeacuta TaxID=43131 RepID=UPI00333F6540